MKVYNSGKKILLYKMRHLINQIPKGGVVLDLGCGTGDLVRYFAKHYKRLTFIGLDVHQTTLNYARQFKQKNARYVKGDGKAIPLKDNSVDFAYSTSVIEHVTDDVLFVNEARRVLKKDSFLTITTLNREVVPFENTNPDHKRHYTIQELRKLLTSRGFRIVSVDYRWSKLSRKIDNFFLNKMKNKLFRPKILQPCVTAVSKKKRDSWKFKLLLFLFDSFIDPFITLIVLTDFKINGAREKYDIMIVCKKI